MKIQNRNLIRFVLPCILILICGCSNGQLSNSTAEKTLKSQYPRYITSTVQINDFSLSPSIPNELKLLSARGLATYRYIAPGTSGYGCYGMLTESGGPYLVSKISNEYIVLAIAKIDFDKILGIKEIPAFNTSEVQYTEKIVQITPVGEIYNDINIGKSYNVSATFIKYNDGWRMENMSTTTKQITISEKMNQSSEKDKLSNNESKKIRLDGIFQSEILNNTRSFYRFYPDGTVINSTSTGTAADVIKWLKKEEFVNDYNSRGKYEIKSNKIYFKTTAGGYGTVAYEGNIISDTEIKLKIKSYINANESEQTISFYKENDEIK